MRMLLAFLLLTISANAHWTHDESLAHEIGPPPGEEDFDMANLSDELISTTEKQEEEVTTYRVTIGTRADGGSTSKFKIWLKGPPPMEEKVGGKHLRYYMGPFMDYEKAAEMAPPLKLGMKPLVDKNSVCSGKDSATHMPKVCSKELASDMDPCEPNSKACLTAIDSGSVGYAMGDVTTMYNDAAEESAIKTGPIQRSQVKMKDVGQIFYVEMAEDVSWGGDNRCYKLEGATKRGCSSPWAPAFVKISTNDPKTGIGNGIFYIKPRDDLFVGTIGVKGEGGMVDQTENLIAKPAAPTASGLPEDGSFNAVLEKCVAQLCEEEMDTKLGLMSMKTEFGEAFASLRD